ncbi:zinc ABC transporter substrate-binding protein [Candidatus Dependentiae bacterium]|nr:zinc ABC transporter substrate-binding protein [Candidatus Dependentiae bacterium]
MKNKLKTSTAIFVFIVTFLSIKPVMSDVRVFTSIEPVAYLIEKIGSNKVIVNSMIRAGESPHTYEPKPSQLAALSKADMYVKLGSGIEFESVWMPKLLKINQNMKIIDASKNVKLIKFSEPDHNHENGESHECSADPHIWLSVSNAMVMTENIKKALCIVDPANKYFYESNSNILIEELTALKRDTENKLRNIKNRKFIIFHPSFGYFADEFNLIQIPVEIGGKEPGPKQLRKIIQTAKEQNVKVIFASRSFSKKNAELIADEIKGKVQEIDELSKDYIKNLKKITEVFRKNLE